MKYDQFTNDTYNLYTIETNKFKNIHLELVFSTPATVENLTYLSLLCSCLVENSKNYPTRKELTRRLYDLYNANIYAVSTRVGNTILSNFILDFLDTKYTKKELLDESIHMLFDMIFNPLVIEKEFDEDTFNRVKKRIANDIEALKENPKESSILEALKSIDEGDIRSANATGDIDILNDITPKKLYKFYQNFLENSNRDIYVIGSCDMKQVDRIIRKYATFKSIPDKRDDIFLDEINIKKEKSTSRNGNITQTNLVQIYSCNNLTEYECNYVVPIFNMLWGSGSLESKLYKALREDNSLCYNVSTFYQKYDSILVLHTAIDEASTKLALKLINNTLSAMKKGDFSEEDITNAKNLLITSLQLSLDSPNRLIDMYIFKNLTGLPDIDIRIDDIKNITKNDIMKIIKKIKLVCNYRVKGAKK